MNYFLQTLTTLYIAENHIGDLGAKYLADALQTNRVILTGITLFILYSFLFDIDTTNTLRGKKSNR